MVKEKMRNNSIFRILLLTINVILFWGCSKKNSEVPINYNDASFVDSIIKNTYEAMPEEEFEKEMLKGIQGDLTQDQIDSINQQLIKENYYMRVR